MNCCERCGQEIPSDVDHCINLSCKKGERIELLESVYEAAKVYHGAFYYGNGRNQSTVCKALLDAVDNAARWIEDSSK